MGKNWRAIAKVPNENLRIALIEIREHSDLGKRLSDAFKTCFEGPDEPDQIHLSRLVLAGWNCVDESATVPDLEEAALKHDIPTLLFALDEVHVPGAVCTLSNLWILQNRPTFGKVVEIHGTEFVILDVIKDLQITVAPLDYVCVDTVDLSRPTNITA